jgi:hypothetical protein
MTTGERLLSSPSVSMRSDAVATTCSTASFVIAFGLQLSARMLTVTRRTAMRRDVRLLSGMPFLLVVGSINSTSYGSFWKVAERIPGEVGGTSVQFIVKTSPSNGQPTSTRPAWVQPTRSAFSIGQFACVQTAGPSVLLPLVGLVLAT